MSAPSRVAGRAVSDEQGPTHTQVSPRRSRPQNPDATPGELASMRERSLAAHRREAQRIADEKDLICEALVAILTALAER